MILSAKASPIPGRVFSWSLVAELRSIISCFGAGLVSFFVSGGVFVAVDGAWLKLREQAITRAQMAIASCAKRLLIRIIFLLSGSFFIHSPAVQFTNQI